MPILQNEKAERGVFDWPHLYFTNDSRCRCGSTVKIRVLVGELGHGLSILKCVRCGTSTKVFQLWNGSRYPGTHY